MEGGYGLDPCGSGWRSKAVVVKGYEPPTSSAVGEFLKQVVLC